MKKPIKWAIYCWSPIEIYAWDIWEWILHEATFLKSFVYKPHKDSDITDEFAYWVSAPEIFREITKEQYDEYIRDGTDFDINCNEI